MALLEVELPDLWLVKETTKVVAQESIRQRPEFRDFIIRWLTIMDFCSPSNLRNYLIAIFNRVERFQGWDDKKSAWEKELAKRAVQNKQRKEPLHIAISVYTKAYIPFAMDYILQKCKDGTFDKKLLKEKTTHNRLAKEFISNLDLEFANAYPFEAELKANHGFGKYHSLKALRFSALMKEFRKQAPDIPRGLLLLSDAADAICENSALSSPSARCVLQFLLFLLFLLWQLFTDLALGCMSRDFQPSPGSLSAAAVACSSSQGVAVSRSGCVPRDRGSDTVSKDASFSGGGVGGVTESDSDSESEGKAEEEGWPPPQAESAGSPPPAPVPADKLSGGAGGAETEVVGGQSFAASSAGMTMPSLLLMLAVELTRFLLSGPGAESESETISLQEEGWPPPQAESAGPPPPAPVPADKLSGGAGGAETEVVGGQSFAASSAGMTMPSLLLMLAVELTRFLLSGPGAESESETISLQPRKRPSQASPAASPSKTVMASAPKRAKLSPAAASPPDPASAAFYGSATGLCVTCDAAAAEGIRNRFMEQEGNAPLKLRMLQNQRMPSNTMLLVTFTSSAECQAAKIWLDREGLEFHETLQNMVRISRYRIP